MYLRHTYINRFKGNKTPESAPSSQLCPTPCAIWLTRASRSTAGSTFSDFVRLQGITYDFSDSVAENGFASPV